MRDHLAVVRLELAAAASGAENADAIVRVTPVGEGGGPWAQQLLHMYTAWAERTGRKTDPSCNPNELRINGLATRDLLDGENGIHRHVGPEGRELHARVLVLSHDGSSEQQDADTVVVRVYEQGKRLVVRDPRTKVRISHVASVLEHGRLDPFLIAWLRQNGREDAGPGED